MSIRDMDHFNSLPEAIADFARKLKDHGFKVSPASVIDAMQAVPCVGVENVVDFKTALKSVFVTKVEELVLFERLFKEFWSENEVASATQSNSPEDLVSNTVALLESVNQASPESLQVRLESSRATVVFSPAETLRNKRFSNISEFNNPKVTNFIRQIVEPLRNRIRSARSRAYSTGRLDLRKLLRKNFRYGTEIVQLPVIRQKPKLKRLVFLCDVSGSMNPHLELILCFIKEISQLPMKVETFVFATRLSRITFVLKSFPFGRALEEIGSTVRDWSGGTRIGKCLEQFTRTFGAEMLGPSTITIIHSDGWDRGDSALLERQLDIIRRKSYRLLWINPLLGYSDYEPTCRGMKVALPFLDYFLPGRSISNFEQVVGTLRALTS